jgi:signal transduction histidine kinase
MVARSRTDSTSTRQFAVRLHDASAGLALGIGLLKGWSETRSGDHQPSSQFVIEAFEQVLIELRQLSRTLSGGHDVRPRPADFRESLDHDAKGAGIDLELRVIGQEHLLPPAHLELVGLAGREAIRNVKRHSGSSLCRVTLDASICPFVFEARDWGAGIQPATNVSGGIALLSGLARDIGCVLTISSQVGFGTRMTLTGPRCAIARDGHRSSRQSRLLRSVVADQSLSSRKRVASTRPLGLSEEQIT